VVPIVGHGSIDQAPGDPYAEAGDVYANTQRQHHDVTHEAGLSVY
jgi:hypothetical protein